MITELENRFEGLPDSDSNHLAVYVLGPGFGESQVVVTPERKCVVIDCCVDERDQCLPALLLSHLRIPQIDLLIVTHPDLDHIEGLGILIDRHPPRQVWRYPFAGNLRELTAYWIRQDPEDNRLQRIHEALVNLDRLQEANITFEVNYGRRPWPSGPSNFSVTCIAPTPRDQIRTRRFLDKLVKFSKQKFELALPLQRYLSGEKDALRGNPNLSSLAVVVEWHGHRILLGGDVEAAFHSPHSGWRGILDLLQKDGLIDLIRNVDLVKVPHHGSINAFCEEAWNEHARSRPTTAIVTPFEHGRTHLPSPYVLSRLLEYATTLGITSDHRNCRTRAQGAGWQPAMIPAVCDFHCIAAILDRNGSIELYIGGRALAFSRH
jgi:beta-lactamase superfamily II metal-dependent hydrolase